MGRLAIGALSSIRSGAIRSGAVCSDELVAYEVPETEDLIHEPPTPERRAASRRRMA
jgi:hypothetical protein